ncbi:MAG: cytochrome P450 [Burkholderiales bacterium]|nr:MAG: cytochrome P450 [Burkholderiales bacterium]
MSEPIELYSTAIDADPFPMYARLREDHPCYWSPSANIWFLSRYEDVFNAAQDWETYSSSRGNLIDEIPGRSGGTLGTTDPPRHDRLRLLAQSAFTKRNIEYLAAPAVEIADQAVARILEHGGRFDFVSDFSSIVTVGLLFRMLGLPAANPAEIRHKVVLSISTDKERRGRNDTLNAAFFDLSSFIASEVTKRRADPQDDLVTRLAEAEIDGDRLSEREVVLTTSMFVVAGVESLSSFMSLFALNLARFPQARARLVADPTLVEQAIEESLRYNTSAQRFKRSLTRDVELHGQTMRAGDSVVLAYGSANRDHRKFENPDVYDIDRRPMGHLGFGVGKHFCIGNQLARLVTRLAMQRFLAAIPDYELTRPDFGWVPSSNFRSPMALPFQVV